MCLLLCLYPSQPTYTATWPLSTHLHRPYDRSQPTYIHNHMAPSVTSVKFGMIQRRLAWPLRKDDTHNIENDPTVWGGWVHPATGAA